MKIAFQAKNLKTFLGHIGRGGVVLTYTHTHTPQGLPGLDLSGGQECYVLFPHPPSDCQ